jgi:hypothetical protein
MRIVIAAGLLLVTTPAIAATFTPVHVAPIHVAPAVRVTPGVHTHSMIKPGAKAGHAGKHSRTVTVVTDTSTPKTCASGGKPGKDCPKQ